METRAALASAMARADDECQAVVINGDGAEFRRVEAERRDADLESAQTQFLGDAAGQHAVHGDADLGKLAAKLVDGRQQVHAGVFVGGQLQAAALQALQFVERAGGFAAQRQQSQRVVAQQIRRRR